MQILYKSNNNIKKLEKIGRLILSSDEYTRYFTENIKIDEKQKSPFELTKHFDNLQKTTYEKLPIENIINTFEYCYNIDRRRNN